MWSGMTRTVEAYWLDQVVELVGLDRAGVTNRSVLNSNQWDENKRGPQTGGAGGGGKGGRAVK